MVADYPGKIPPGDFSEKNFGQAAGTGKENGLVALLKNVLIALVLIGVVLFARDGLMGALRALDARLRRLRKAGAR